MWMPEWVDALVNMSPQNLEMIKGDLPVVLPLFAMFAAVMLRPKVWQTDGGQRMVASSWRGLAAIWLMRGLGVYFLWVLLFSGEVDGFYESWVGLCAVFLCFWAARGVRKQRNVRLEDL